MVGKADIHYFGVRHHGPGTADRLLHALNDLQPQAVLIEGPTDCSELLPLLAHEQMQTPVSLLAYSSEDSHLSIYYPFTEYSPEYQACLWAIRNNVETHFIDLPVAVQLATRKLAEESNEVVLTQSDSGEADTSSETNQHSGNTEKESESPVTDRYWQITSDPIGLLARLAGYEDGESWWNDLIEQNQDDNREIFSVVEEAMSALRSELPVKDSKKLEAAEADDLADRELLREAFMRLEIAKKAKGVSGPVAVVCGAWHVPALKAKHKASEDRQLLKSLPKKLTASKLRTTWIPWTSPRLSQVSGYGAGVDAPGWYQHLWNNRNNTNVAESWMTHIAVALRDQGHVVSSASVIEGVRLSQSLAVVRGRPSAGFEEMRDAAIATMCFGESLIWLEIANKLLLGNQVGTIPDDAPLMPLLEDLQRQQKQLRLKPEALEKEVSLDLRSEVGLNKSVLLHRLHILDVPWGQQADKGSSRGTFREKWLLSWEPEYAVRLVENLVYGTSIETAAASKMCESIAEQSHLNKLAEDALYCLKAKLDSTAQLALDRLNVKASQTGDCVELLAALPPLIHVERYGTARDINITHIKALVSKMGVQAALLLPYACRNLNEEEASHYRQVIQEAWQAMLLGDLDDEALSHWWQAFEEITESHSSDAHIAGLATRLLYQGDKLSEAEVNTLLQRALSPGLPGSEAAKFFEGFFSGATQRLLYDSVLLETVENWLAVLQETDFVEFLPLFRRVFADLDAMERKRLIDAICGKSSSGGCSQIVVTQALPDWEKQVLRIAKLVRREKIWNQ